MLAQNQIACESLRMNKKALTLPQIENLYQNGLVSEIEYRDLLAKYSKRIAKIELRLSK